MCDSEGGNRFLPITRKIWDPKVEDPPVADGTWDTCVVYTRDYETMNKVYQWLQVGRHPFKSLIIDSISELQIKCLESIAGRSQVKTDQWGELLRSFTGLMRDVRDLTTHPTNPLEAVVLTAMMRESNGKYHAYLQGQSAVQTPYLFDLVGAIAVEEWAHPDPTQPPYTVRRMYVDKHPLYDVGERVQGRLGKIVEQQDLNIETMMDKIFGPRNGSGEVPHLPTTE